jgi:hypothetical protein
MTCTRGKRDQRRPRRADDLLDHSSNHFSTVTPPILMSFVEPSSTEKSTATVVAFLPSTKSASLANLISSMLGDPRGGGRDFTREIFVLGTHVHKGNQPHLE